MCCGKHRKRDSAERGDSARWKNQSGRTNELNGNSVSYLETHSVFLQPMAIVVFFFFFCSKQDLGSNLLETY